MISGEVVGSVAVQARLRNLSKEMHGGVAKAILALTIELQRHIKEDKLSGQVLNTRSSNLRNSITYQVNDTGSSIEGIVGTNKRAIPYAAIHEFGGVIAAKRAKYLRFKIGNKWISKKTVIMPERSYLRTSLKDMEPKIKEKIEIALKGFAI